MSWHNFLCSWTTVLCVLVHTFKQNENGTNTALQVCVRPSHTSWRLVWGRVWNFSSASPWCAFHVTNGPWFIHAMVRMLRYVGDQLPLRLKLTPDQNEPGALPKLWPDYEVTPCGTAVFLWPFDQNHAWIHPKACFLNSSLPPQRVQLRVFSLYSFSLMHTKEYSTNGSLDVPTQCQILVDGRRKWLNLVVVQNLD